MGFSISYPDHWSVVPAPWVRQLMARAATTSEKLAEYLSKGGQPFLVAQDPGAPPDVAIPAVKCQAFPDFEVLACEPECMVAVSATSDPSARPEQDLLNIIRSIRLEHA